MLPHMESSVGQCQSVPLQASPYNFVQLADRASSILFNPQDAGISPYVGLHWNGVLKTRAYSSCTAMGQALALPPSILALKPNARG